MKAVLDDYDGKINYDTIHQMPYLEAAIEENLRLYSPGVRYPDTELKNSLISCQ